MAGYQSRRRVVRRGSSRSNAARQQETIRKGLIYGGVGLGALLVIVLLICLFGGPGTFTAERGTLSFSTQGSGIVVRSERLYTAEGYGKAEYIAQEGQVLMAGSPICDVYSNDYSDSDYASLKELQEKILDYQQNNAQSGIVDEDMNSLNEQIAVKTEQIRRYIAGEEAGDLDQLQREIRQLMSERSEILRNAAKEDSQLADFYAQEQTLITRIQNYKRTIVAENDGIVSFYFDGTEQLLTPANIPLLTVKNINNILNGTFRYDTGSEQTFNKPLYRLVERNNWYVVMIADEEIPQFEGNTEFTVTFSFGSDYTYTANISDHISEGGKELYCFHFTGDVDKMLRARQVSFEVSARYVGITVPKSAIKKEDGVEGVYFFHEGKKTFAPVEILISEEKEAIIRTKDPASPLKIGSEIFK